MSEKINEAGFVFLGIKKKSKLITDKIMFQIPTPMALKPPYQISPK